MVHHSQFGDGVANSGRPATYVKGHSQSFTAGSNPNSAPMPSFAGNQRRRPPIQQPPSRSYTPQPEPTFDLMASAQPMFGDANFQLPNMPFDLQGPISMAPPTASYSSGLPAANFDVPAESYMTHDLSDYDPSAFAAAAAAAAAAVTAVDTSFSRHNHMGPTPTSSSKLNSPFTSNGPVLAPPISRSQAPMTDSMHKNQQPQTPRKIIQPKSSTVKQLLPSGLKTPLAQRDPNAHATTTATKRAIPDSPTIEHTTSPRKATKRSKMDEPGRHRELIPIPDAESFPEVDAGEEWSKPPYTYAQMIALAIWKAPSRRRTLAQIYEFIRTTWCYYRKDDTWENSIRHNLSLHKKFFEKQARAKDDPGKGNYWLIIPGNERELLDVYLKEKVAPPTLAAPHLETPALPYPQEPILPPQQYQMPFPPQQLQPSAPIQTDPSSDATIPASDHVFDETDLLDTTLTSSPPAAAISSRRASAPSDTPTRAARIGGSSGRTSGKRKRYSMVDSGYMTGLDSSIMRYGQQRAPVFSSEADNEGFQGGGRAEDAIRKLRASSNESPSSRRTRMLPPSSSPLGKGSPLRYRAASPTRKTPANTKKSALQLADAPSLPPPKTTSKYKNSPIRQHEKLRANVRSMLETPQCVRDYNKKYPGRRNNVDRFAIFEDNTSGPELESPLVANSAGRMLDELMSAKRNQKTPFITSSPFKDFPLFPPNDENAAWHLESPSKVFSAGKFSSPSKYLPDTGNDSENWLSMNNLDAEGLDLGDLGGFDESAALDLTQTFRSIGERPVEVEAYGPTTLRRFG